MSSDLTVDDGHPQPNPRCWPECSECGVAYVLRNCVTFGAELKYQWLWQRDCKHKKADGRIAGDTRVES